ncbi:hypothetical protein AVEN_223626-1 [Araneus ventricosus]|uniref:Uncharacterized protein n=1 Tax=Araneus ventricosus TaxID=182803 RepID=A0A4Y2MP10_ARAVE|nr:hypothetical protein AVEN_223626-1 [Araneus ventricosus]
MSVNSPIPRTSTSETTVSPGVVQPYPKTLLRIMMRFRKREFRADQVCGSMKPRHLNCLAHFGDPPDGSIDVRESVYMYLYKEKIAREHLTGPQHYPDNGLVSGTRGKVSRNQEEEEATLPNT